MPMLVTLNVSKYGSILDRFYINGKLALEKYNIDEHICIKGGLLRDLIKYAYFSSFLSLASLDCGFPMLSEKWAS